MFQGEKDTIKPKYMYIFGLKKSDYYKMRFCKNCKKKQLQMISYSTSPEYMGGEPLKEFYIECKCCKNRTKANINVHQPFYEWNKINLKNK